VTSFQGKVVFCVSYKTWLRPLSRLKSLNQTRWKQTFYIKNVCEDLTFAMMINKVETLFGGGPRGKNHGFRGYFNIQATSACQQPLLLLNLQKRCIWVSYNIP